jgi:iron-sulfur cluster repair protein YtfE (RIC family)
MERPKPIKRNKNLQPLSRDHYHGLVLCKRIRIGISKSIATERIKSYTDWYFKNHANPHFEIEEKYLFTILDNKNELITRAISEHRRLEQLFNEPNDILNSLNLIEVELEQHVRFEERILFNEIQKSASEEQLQLISEVHSDAKFKDNLEDEFWL